MGRKLKAFKRFSSNKYGARKTPYNGVKYDSAAEARYARELDLRLMAKDIKKWERQNRYDLIVEDYLISWVKPDFLVYHNDGTREIVEVKGPKSPSWIIRWKLFLALYKNKFDKITVVGANAPELKRGKYEKKPNQ